MAGTGTVMDKAAQTIKNMNSDCLQVSFVNDSGGILYEGQEVILKTTGLIDKRTTGVQKPLGIVVVGGADGKDITVRVYCLMILRAKAIGGTLNAGTFVKQNGNISTTTGAVEVVAAAEGDIVSHYVLKGGAANAEITVGVLYSPLVVFTPSAYAPSV